MSETYYTDGGHPLRLNKYWDGRLEEWLEVLRIHDPDGEPPAYTQTWCFPTDELRDEYLATLDSRDEEDVRQLLRWFLFDIATMGGDEDNLQKLLLPMNKNRDRLLRESEYHRRLLRSGHAHPGVRWALNLLPDHPRMALDAINA